MSLSCSVTSSPIDPGALLEGLVHQDQGAALLFVGVVRNRNEGLPVTHLDYEAYREMAEQTLTAIASEAQNRWDTGEIRVVHRIGRLRVGETSVAIAVASEHRDAAYAASRYIIEELKRRAPIWKRESYQDGQTAWLDGARPEGSEEGR